MTWIRAWFSAELSYKHESIFVERKSLARAFRQGFCMFVKSLMSLRETSIFFKCELVHEPHSGFSWAFDLNIPLFKLRPFVEKRLKLLYQRSRMSLVKLEQTFIELCVEQFGSFKPYTCVNSLSFLAVVSFVFIIILFHYLVGGCWNLIFPFSQTDFSWIDCFF